MKYTPIKHKVISVGIALMLAVSPGALLFKNQIHSYATIVTGNAQILNKKEPYNNKPYKIALNYFFKTDESLAPSSSFARIFSVIDGDNSPLRIDNLMPAKDQDGNPITYSLKTNPKGSFFNITRYADNTVAISIDKNLKDKSVITPIVFTTSENKFLIFNFTKDFFKDVYNKDVVSAGYNENIFSISEKNGSNIPFLIDSLAVETIENGKKVTHSYTVDKVREKKRKEDEENQRKLKEQEEQDKKEKERQSEEEKRIKDIEELLRKNRDSNSKEDKTVFKYDKALFSYGAVTDIDDTKVNKFDKSIKFEGYDDNAENFGKNPTPEIIGENGTPIVPNPSIQESTSDIKEPNTGSSEDSSSQNQIKKKVWEDPNKYEVDKEMKEIEKKIGLLTPEYFKFSDNVKKHFLQNGRDKIGELIKKSDLNNINVSDFVAINYISNKIENKDKDRDEMSAVLSYRIKFMEELFKDKEKLRSMIRITAYMNWTDLSEYDKEQQKSIKEAESEESFLKMLGISNPENPSDGSGNGSSGGNEEIKLEIGNWATIEENENISNSSEFGGWQENGFTWGTSNSSNESNTWVERTTIDNSNSFYDTEKDDSNTQKQGGYKFKWGKAESSGLENFQSSTKLLTDGVYKSWKVNLLNENMKAIDVDHIKQIPATELMKTEIEFQPVEDNLNTRLKLSIWAIAALVNSLLTYSISKSIRVRKLREEFEKSIILKVEPISFTNFEDIGINM